jgi:hypothetical protein
VYNVKISGRVWLSAMSREANTISTGRYWGTGPIHHHKNKLIFVSMHIYKAFTNVIRTHMLSVLAEPVVFYASTLLPSFSSYSNNQSQLRSHGTTYLLRLCFTRNTGKL